MPIVLELEFGGITISVYFKDHNPPHVHALAADAEAVFLLKTLECVHHEGFSQATLGKIRRSLAQSQADLIDKWNEYQDG